MSDEDKETCGIDYNEETFASMAKMNVRMTIIVLATMHEYYLC